MAKKALRPDDEDYLSDLKTAKKFFSHLCEDNTVTWMWRTEHERWCITNKHKGTIAVYDKEDTMTALTEFMTTCRDADKRKHLKR